MRQLVFETVTLRRSRGGADPWADPWSAADALVGLLGLCSKTGSRGTRADQGVRPTSVRYERLEDRADCVLAASISAPLAIAKAGIEIDRSTRSAMAWTASPSASLTNDNTLRSASKSTCTQSPPRT